PIQSAFKAMDLLEAGAITNPDEARMIGHCWLGAPELAPTPEIAKEIRDSAVAAQFGRGLLQAGDLRKSLSTTSNTLRRATTIFRRSLGGNVPQKDLSRRAVLLRGQFTAAPFTSSGDSNVIHVDTTVSYATWRYGLDRCSAEDWPN